MVIIDLGSIFALSISGIFYYNILSASRFLEVFRGSCFHFLCLLLKSFPGSLSKHFQFLSSADSRSCPVRGFRDCFWVYFLILNCGLHFHCYVGFCFTCIIITLQFQIKSWFVVSFVELCKTNDNQNILNSHVQ